MSTGDLPDLCIHPRPEGVYIRQTITNTYVIVWAKTSLVHTSDFTQISGSKIL